MPRARAKPALMEVPWQTTPAQEAGTTTEPVKGAEGRTIVRRRREALIIRLGRWRTEGGKRLRPELSQRQVIAGERLLDAWCLTQTSPSPPGEYVQATPDYAALAISRAERAFELADLTACLPRASRAPLMALIQSDTHPGHALDHVRQGLDAIADMLKIR